MKYKIDHPREIVHEFTSIADSRKMYSLEQYLFKQREDGESFQRWNYSSSESLGDIFR